MINSLRERGLQCKTIDLGIFDYLKHTVSEQCHSIKVHSVAFAGNLEKSIFLEDWISMPKNYDLELYGLLSQEKLNACQEHGKIVYHGSLSPNEIVEKIEGSFGLVWDGTSVETCDGDFGEYLKLNDPHKFLLYIAAGMPVIIWDKSALSDFVREYGIGICVENLHEIQNIMNNTSDDEYSEMLSNLKKVQERVNNGSFLSDCIRTIRSFDSEADK